jgi:hypothetical protein
VLLFVACSLPEVTSYLVDRRGSHFAGLAHTNWRIPFSCATNATRNNNFSFAMSDGKVGEDSPTGWVFELQPLEHLLMDSSLTEKKEEVRRASVFDDEERRRKSIMDLTNNTGGE